MSSSSTSGTTARLGSPEYRNWLALGHALTTELSQGLRPFINREVVKFYNNLTARLATAVPCTCFCVPRRRPNQFHDMSTCAWANVLQALHHSKKPNWKQSDSTKWLDPNLGPWEIVKLFLPDLGGHVMINSTDDMDITGILNLMHWCSHFAIPQHSIKDVRDTRNNKWIHVPTLELTDADKNTAFDAIKNLLMDPNLAHDPDVQKALRDIGKLKVDSDLHSMEAQVLADFKEIIQHEIAAMDKDLTNLTEESERNKEQQNQHKQREMLRKTLEDAKTTRSEGKNVLEAVPCIFGYVMGNLTRSVKGISKRNAIAWLILSLLFWRCTILGDSFYKDGCSVQVYGDPWELKYFDFIDFINSSRTEFIGRQWLYHEMEHILEGTSNRGVLITGNPGSGKSAFLSHLLCSTTASPVIHNRILAYHFCLHFDKATQDAAKFVRNLANMIAWKIIEYREYILSDSFVRRVLYKECPQDPEWCFEQAILTPLKNIHPQPRTPWYIVIDALDECSSERAEILNVLKSKTRRPPKWLKLIVSSRNVSTIVSGLEGLQKLELRSDDERNLLDIDTYLSLKVFSLKESIIHRIKPTLAIIDNDTPTQAIVSSLAEKGNGSFLYVKVVLDLWLALPESISWQTFPKTLDSTYQLYFERKYGTPESFQSLRQIFEVLVAAYSPLTVHEMHALLRLGNPSLDMEYEFLPKIDQISLFLWHGSGNGFMRFHHSSLSEWLTRDTNRGKFYYVKKQNGHNLLARYYLVKAVKNNSPLKPDKAFHLASHIVEGGLDKRMEQRFLSLPSDHVNTSDPVTQTTALHYSSRSSNVDVTKLLVQYFSNVNCLDNDQRTPSFIAASVGHVDNLMTLFNHGANLNHTVRYLDVESASHSQDPVKECKRKKCQYWLLHTAAEQGNVKRVKCLIQHHAGISETTGANNTAIQLAAAHGHLETVETLKKAGCILDGLSLHHSAAGGHKDVVQYLRREGVKDTKIYVYDNRHLYLRETALPAAVRRGHTSVIEVLLMEDGNALNCTNSAGRHPQHEAVHFKNYNALEMFLQYGANATVECKTGMLSSIQFEPFIKGKLAQYRCPRGFTPLHIVNFYGYHSITRLLIKHNADVNAGDCNGSTPLHVASCQDKSALMVLLTNSGADVNAASLNGSTPLHSAAACFAEGVFSPLFDLGCNPLTTDSEGMTALHYVVKDIKAVDFEYLADLYVSKPKGWIENSFGVSKKETLNKYVEYPWLSAVIEFVKSFATTERTRRTNLLGMQDKRNRTVFDHLEKKINISFLLLGSNKTGGNGMVLSLTPLTYAYDVTIGETVKSRAPVLNEPYEPGRIPTFFTRAVSKTLTSIFTNLNCSNLVQFLNLYLVCTVCTVNFVLLAGVDVHCRDASGLSPRLAYLRVGSRSKVLVKHNVEVVIICGNTFMTSAFHLASYHKLHYLHYLNEFLLGSDNWQKYLETGNAIFDYLLDTYEERNNNGSMEIIRTGDGSLTTTILSHPNEIKVIDECFDAEGFNALHRAAQGANLVAIQKFLSWGANHSSKNADGFSPLWFSILYAMKYRPFLNLETPSILTALEVELAYFSASAILNHILQNGTFDVGCDKSRSDLTLYHVAATRGMWQFIARLLSSDRITGIDVDCPNKDRITPMYLARFIGGDSCEWRSPWCKAVDVIKSYDGTLQYPTFEAKYFLVFNIFFGINPSTLFLELTEDEIMTLQETCGLDLCKKYRTANADLFMKPDEVYKIGYDCQQRLDKCSTFEGDCPADIKTALPHFSFVLLIVSKQLATKLLFYQIRNSFVAFLNDEIERLKVLLHTAIRPHAEMSCKYVPPNNDDKTETIDLCSQFEKTDLETVVHKFYCQYKVSILLWRTQTK